MYNIKNNYGRYTTRKKYPLIILQAAFFAWYRKIGIIRTIAFIALVTIFYPMLSDIYGKEVIINHAQAQVVVKEKEAQIVVYPTALKAVADCESGNGKEGSAKQFNDDGSVVIGQFTPAQFGKDVGKHQINEKVWGKKAKELGYDIYTEGGNDLMAIYIHKQSGLSAWKASKKCWSK